MCCYNCLDKEVKLNKVETYSFDNKFQILNFCDDCVEDECKTCPQCDKLTTSENNDWNREQECCVSCEEDQEQLDREYYDQKEYERTFASNYC